MSKATLDTKQTIQLSSLEEWVLCTLVGNELYPVQIAKAFEDVSAGTVSISLNTIYPVLARLEAQELVSAQVVKGLVSTKGAAKRKFYQLTALGTYALAEQQRFRNQLSSWQPGYGHAIYE